MKHLPRAVGFLVLFLCASVRADLTSDVQAILRDKALAKGEASVELVKLNADASPPEILFRHNSDIPLLPASNLKIITTSAALATLGPSFKFRTVLALRGDDLVIIGDGDPTLGDAEYLKKLGWDSTTVFRNWADALKKRGITRINNVIVDDSVFDTVFQHPNWATKQLHLRYEAGVGGVNLNTNCLDFYLTVGAAGSTVSYRTDPVTKFVTVRNDCVAGEKQEVWLSRAAGRNEIDLRGQASTSNKEPLSVTIHDPPMFAATVFAEVLAKAGVQVRGDVARDRTIRLAMSGVATDVAATTQPLDPIAVHETPIAAVLARANKDSQNVYAEALCKRTGAAATGESGSWQNGTAAIAAFVRSCGGTEGEFALDDGCGLSRKNGLSARTMIKVLSFNFASANREAYISSLSIAGVDGTLEKRFTDSDLRGRVHAKTGYISGVSALSGYLRARNDQWYAFSILMNGITDVSACKKLQEAIIKAIDVHSSDEKSSTTQATTQSGAKLGG